LDTPHDLNVRLSERDRSAKEESGKGDDSYSPKNAHSHVATPQYFSRFPSGGEHTTENTASLRGGAGARRFLFVSGLS
jgi:hypothetical protein